MSEINFYNMDCMQLMASKPDNYYDLAICDPEYGINQGGHKNHTRSKLAISKKYHSFEDKKPPSKEYFNELQRISKHQIIWGANHFIENISKSNSSSWIVWDKDNGETDFADCELAWSNFNKAVRKFTFKWQGMLQQNMKNKELRIHPTQKPVQLYRWLLQKYAKTGQLILDTHGGSMSSAIACHMEGFDLDICEIDKEYFDESVNRFNNYKMQQKLLL